jgi:hypothetical protein
MLGMEISRFYCIPLETELEHGKLQVKEGRNINI